MSVYKKLQEARSKFHKLSLKKTGENKFAGYKYFELGDFLPEVQGICAEVGLCGVVSFSVSDACLTIVDIDKPDDRIVINSPMGSAALKGCHEVQNIGAVETYQRRYLWVTAMEIVENDAIDATTGDEPKKQTQSVDVKPKATVAGKPNGDIPQNTGTLQVVDVMKSIVDAVAAEDWATVSKTYFESVLDKDDRARLYKGLQPNVQKILLAEGKKRNG